MKLFSNAILSWTLLYIWLKLGLRLKEFLWNGHNNWFQAFWPQPFVTWHYLEAARISWDLQYEPTFYNEGMLFANKYKMKTSICEHPCMYDWRIIQPFFALCLNILLILQSPFWWHSKVITDCSFGRIAAFVFGVNHSQKKGEGTNELDSIAVFLFLNKEFPNFKNKFLKNKK